MLAARQRKWKACGPSNLLLWVDLNANSVWSCRWLTLLLRRPQCPWGWLSTRPSQGQLAQSAKILLSAFLYERVCLRVVRATAETTPLHLICFLDNQDEVLSFSRIFLQMTPVCRSMTNRNAAEFTHSKQSHLSASHFKEGKCVFPKENSCHHLFYVYTEDRKELWEKVLGVRTLLRQILTLVSHIYTCSHPQHSKRISLAEAMRE